MITIKHMAQAAGIAAVSVLLLSACHLPSSSKSSAAVSTTTVPSIPTGFDPCVDIPQSVLDELQWTFKISRQNSADDGTDWRGCSWVKSNYYAVVVYMTNATPDKVRNQHYPDTRQLTIGGRQAVSSRQDADHPANQCTIDVAIKGGSLEFFLTNPKTNTMGGALNSCDLAREGAEVVTPTLPSRL